MGLANINWPKLVEALRFYEIRCGYIQVTVPWLVSREALALTVPDNVSPFMVTKDKGPLGSGEQGFLELMLRGWLPKGQYVTLTPCFRNELVVDNLHRESFAKVELINTEEVSLLALQDMIDQARSFFGRFLPVEILKVGDNEFDIVSVNEKRELGSYGIRGSYETGPWIYGTGCAEPRLSQVLSMIGLQEEVF